MEDKSFRLINRAAIFVVILWLALLLIVLIFFNDGLNAGTLGDSFGIITSLFTGFTVLGLVYTIILQRQQMKQQRQEITISQDALKATLDTLDLTRQQLQLTKDELEISNREFIEQNKTMRHQQFETTFFSLLNSRMLMLQNTTLVLSEQETWTSGRILAEYLNLINSELHFETSDTKPFEERLQEYKEIYTEELHGPFRNYIDLMIDTLNNVLVFVETTKVLDDESKQFYYDVIGSQLQPNEKSILYAHYHFSTDTDEDILERIHKFGADFGRIPTESFSKCHDFMNERELSEWHKNARKKYPDIEE